MFLLRERLSLDQGELNLVYVPVESVVLLATKILSQEVAVEDEIAFAVARA